MENCGKTNVDFTITKGIDNTFIFTIKADQSTLPIEISPTDTFTAILRKLSDGDAVLTKNLTTADALSGKVQLVITAAEGQALVASRGGPEDRYYVKPSYSLLLDCDTSANGRFIAKVASVYVD